MHTLLDLHNLLQELEIYAAIKDEYCHLFRSYSMEVSGLLRDRICWNSDEESDKTITSISIKNENDDLQELIQGYTSSIRMQPHLLEQLSDLSTKHCISYIIPTSNTDLKNFESIVEAINEFQGYLVEIGTYSYFF